MSSTPSTAAGSIRALPDALIDQIAAGEVVERPVSIVKELVENSLDAGAGRIDVELNAGGTELIAVHDNGHGISAADLPAALRRHWTSKIDRAEQLDDLPSFGFRGEALASIAAVADIEITTRNDQDAHAWRLSANAGDVPARPVPAQGNRGARVEVRRLFHNVPARRRFLKQARTEYLHVLRLMRQFAFARPDVAFSLSQAGSRGLRVAPAAPGGDAPRWRTLFGQQFCARAARLELEVDDLRLSGWVAGPELATSLADTQFLAVNGRIVRDRQLQHAIRLSFDDRLPAGRFPAYALDLQLAPRDVDVNVHPGKLEVRIHDIRRVHDFVSAAVRRALADELPTDDTVPLTTPAGAGLAPGDAGTGSASSPHAAWSSAPTASTAAADARGSYARNTTTVSRPRDDAVRPTPGSHGFGKPVTRVDRRWLIVTVAEGVALLDLDRAWMTILLRRLIPSQSVAASDAPPTRPLLLPQRVRDRRVAETLKANPALAACGFELNDLGSAGLVLRGIPAVLPDVLADVLIDALAGIEPADHVEAIARACVSAIDYGTAERVRGEMLDSLWAGALAAGLEPRDFLQRLDGAALARAAGLRGDE